MADWRTDCTWQFEVGGGGGGEGRDDSLRGLWVGGISRTLEGTACSVIRCMRYQRYKVDCPCNMFYAQKTVAVDVDRVGGHHGAQR